MRKNKYGKNALHLESLNGHKEVVELLINKGIDVNDRNKGGRNALHLASLRGHKEVVELLISKGIDKKLGSSPLRINMTRLSNSYVINFYVIIKSN